MAKPRKKRTQPVSLPMLPLRGLLAFPHMVLHFDVGRKKSVAALEHAMMDDQRIFLVAQRDVDVNDPTVDDIYHVGTIACIKQVLKLPGDNVRILVEGKYRAKLLDCIHSEPYLFGRVVELDEPDYNHNLLRLQALVRQAHELFAQFIDLAVNYTQNFMGASDAALGDTRPDNTSAIIALQRASNAPLELVKLNMYESIEDLGRIYLDMMRVYYGTRYVQVKFLSKQEMNNQPLGMSIQDTNFNKPFDFSILNEIPMSLKLDVGASSYWSEITTVQTLDNLLMQGKIELVDYLERIPEGYVSKKQELIDKLQGMQAQMAGQQSNSPVMGQGTEIPVEGGSGYGQLQRALNETGVI